MNSRAIKSAGKYAVCSGGFLFLVVLLTLGFSFLGNISCALLGGMMMRAAKPSKWLLMATSLVFPAVIFAVLRPGRTELLERQVIVVSLVCFGAFWFTYGVMAWVAAYERKGSPAGTQQLHPAKTACTQPASELSLEQLQGKWCAETAEQNGQVWKKELEIHESLLVLRVADATGQARLVAQAKVKLKNSRSPRTLVVALAASGSAAQG